MAAYTDKKQVPAVPPLAYRMRSFLARVAIFASLILLITVIWLQTRITDLNQQVRFLVSENDKLLADAQAARDLRDQVAQLQQENERLQKDIESGTQIVLALNDGDGRVTLDRQGNLSGLKPSADSYQQAIKSALTTERVKTPLVLAQLTGRSGKLMGGAGGNVSYGLLSPVATGCAKRPPRFSMARAKRSDKLCSYHFRLRLEEDCGKRAIVRDRVDCDCSARTRANIYLASKSGNRGKRSGLTAARSSRCEVQSVRAIED